MISYSVVFTISASRGSGRSGFSSPYWRTRGRIAREKMQVRAVALENLGQECVDGGHGVRTRGLARAAARRSYR